MTGNRPFARSLANFPKAKRLRGCMCGDLVTREVGFGKSICKPARERLSGYTVSSVPGDPSLLRLCLDWPGSQVAPSKSTVASVTYAGREMPCERVLPTCLKTVCVRAYVAGCRCVLTLCFPAWRGGPRVPWRVRAKKKTPRPNCWRDCPCDIDRLGSPLASFRAAINKRSCWDAAC